MSRTAQWVISVISALIASLAPAQTTHTAKILLIVGGQYHNYTELPQTLTQNLQAKLEGKLDPKFTISSDLSLLRSDSLSKYNALMMNVCEQTPLTSEERDGFLQAVSNGLPVIALHCTFWSFQDWPEFKKVLGAFVPGHGHFGTFCLEKTRTKSPILDLIPSNFELTDEPYIVNERDPSMDVLIQTCKSVEDRPGVEPEVWTKSYNRGKIFAMTFGHDARAQQDPNYLNLLANGLLWALGQSK